MRETWAGLQDGAQNQRVAGSPIKMWIFLNQCLRQQENSLKQNLQLLGERRGNTKYHFNSWSRVKHQTTIKPVTKRKTGTVLS